MSQHLLKNLPKLVIFVFMIVAATGYCQTPVTASPSTATPGTATPGSNRVLTIVTNSDEVSLDLVVRDKKNRQVLDLKPGDIAVTDNGSPVKLTELRLVTGNSAQRMVTLVFDRLDSAAAKNGRDIAAKILKMTPPNVSFSVLKIEGRLRLVQRFTSDRNALTTAITIAAPFDKSKEEKDIALAEKNCISVAQTGVDATGSIATPKERADARAMLATLEESQRIVQDRHSGSSLAGLMALASPPQREKGRKIVIYLVQGMKLDSNGQDMLRSIIGAANKAGVTIYAIDTNGIDPQSNQSFLAATAIGGVMANNHLNPSASNDPDFASKVGAATRTVVAAPPPGGIRMGNEQLDRMENQGLGGYSNPLVALALSTGGSFLSAADSLKKPLQLLVDDIATYYEAFYVPSIVNYDGQFRAVVVRPTREGIKIHSTAGYFALAPDASSTIRPFEVPLLKLLDQQNLPTDVKFRPAIIRLGDLAEGNANSVIIETPLDGLEVRQDANTNLYSAHISMVAQIKDKNGAVVEHFSEDAPRQGALEALNNARSEVITLQRHFFAVPGQYVLESAVLDRNSGKAGAQRTTFEISNTDGGPSLSDITFVRRTEPFNLEADPSEPLHYENGKIVPNLSGAIPEKEKTVSLFFMIHPDAQAPEQARLEMEVSRNGEPVGNMPLPLRKSSGKGAIPYMAGIQTSSLRAGRYDVIATLTQGDKTASRATSFTVEGPTLASAAIPRQSSGPSAKDDSKDIEMVSDTKLDEPAIGARPTGRLVITATTNPMAAPTLEEVKAIVENARERALAYTPSLPNFTCVETTSRSVDAAGNGKWKQKDTFAELLRYRDNAETRVMLRVNGRRSGQERSDLNGPMSQGEFGEVFNAVFQPSVKAEFQWKEADMVGTTLVNAIRYQVARQNSSFELGEGNRKVYVGFHGMVYIDNATRGIRRITLEADDAPAGMTMRGTSIAVDYDYIAIGTHDYLMPIRASVSLTQGRRKAVLNEIEFRNYKRYASKSKIIYEGQVLH